MSGIDLIFPYIAWGVCMAFLAMPVSWGIVFTFALLGHLTQFLFKKSSVSVER